MAHTNVPFHSVNMRKKKQQVRDSSIVLEKNESLRLKAGENSPQKKAAVVK